MSGCSLVRASGAPKPPQLHYDVVAEMGGVGIVSGYGPARVPDRVDGDVTDSDEELANTEGSLRPGVTLKLVTLDGRVAGVDEEGDPHEGQMFRGYVDSSSTRPRSTTRAGSAPATSAR